MFDTMHPLVTISVPTLSTLVRTSSAFKAAFKPAATAQAVSYVRLPILRSVCTCMLFGSSVVGALLHGLATSLESARLVALGLMKLPWVVGSSAAFAVGLLVRAAWCWAVRDMYRETVAWYKANVARFGHGIEEIERASVLETEGRFEGLVVCSVDLVGKTCCLEASSAVPGL